MTPPGLRPAVVPGVGQRPVPQLRTPPMPTATAALRAPAQSAQAAPEPERATISIPRDEALIYGDSAAARPIAPPQRAATPPRTTSRFAEPRVAGQRPGVFAEPGKSEPPAPRKTLFGIVTGAIRGTPLPTPAAEAPAATVRQESSPNGEAARPNVRPTVGEEMGIDIPAFLRRQSS
jgi:cell division protein FtsZ